MLQGSWTPQNRERKIFIQKIIQKDSDNQTTAFIGKQNEKLIMVTGSAGSIDCWLQLLISRVLHALTSGADALEFLFSLCIVFSPHDGL